MKIGAHLIIKGIVQGVGFRWFVQREANKLGLTGYVKNLYNGDVEVEVEGERGLIEELIKILKVGNRMSHVTDIRVNWLEYGDHYSSFDIRF